MATILKIKKVHGNPRHSNHRRKMSRKQIAIFGTRRQKAALRAYRRRSRNAGPGSIRKSKKRTRAMGATHYQAGPWRGHSTVFKKFRARRRRKNSALVVTLGAAPGLAGLNPRRRRRNKVARARRTKSGRFAPARRRRRSNRRRYDNPRRRRRYNRRRRYSNNPRPRRRRRYANRHHRRRRVMNRRHRRRSNRRRYSNRRRNPSIMGHSLTSKNALKLIGGGLLGVAAVKFIPSMIPAGLIPGGGSPYVSVLVTGVSAVLAGWLIGKVDKELGDGATFGGLMVAGSQLINAVAPGLAIAGVPIGGLGDLMTGAFVVPQNPLRLPPPPQPAGGGGARVSMSGLARAYGSAF